MAKKKTPKTMEEVSKGFEEFMKGKKPKSNPEKTFRKLIDKAAKTKKGGQ